MIYMASSSNPGMDSDDWDNMMDEVQGAFNDSADVNNGLRATKNTWFVDTKNSMSAADLREVLTEAHSNGSYHEGEPVEDIVLELHKGADWCFFGEDSDKVKNWLDEHLPKKPISLELLPEVRAAMRSLGKTGPGAAP